MSFTFETPQQIWVEISPESQAEAWRQSQAYSTPGSRRNAYLNHLCLEAFLPLLQAEYGPSSSVWPQVNALPSVWEVVNGFAITWNGVRLALIPSQDIDASELRAPQEWVDIPSWAADYYLAAQVNPDEGWVQIWGYTTHQQLKAYSRYDANDHTYCLDAYDLVQDLNGFWVVRQLCPDEVTRSAIAELPTVSRDQSENLLQRLKDPGIVLPRLAVPFELWGALLEKDDWREHLRQQRQASRPEASQSKRWSAPELVNLSQWFQNIFHPDWRPLELGYETRLLPSTPKSTPPDVTRAKQVYLGIPGSSQPMTLVLGLNSETDGRIGIRFQLCSIGDKACLPANVKLALLSTSGTILQSVQAREQDNYIRLKRFKCPPGKRFILEISLGDVSLTEEFIS